MVTDRVGPTITTLKAEVDYLDGEVKKLLTLLADARTESMRLRAALRLFACDCSERELCKFPHGCTNYIARAALEAEGVLAKQEGK